MRKNPIRIVVIGGGTGLSTLLRGLKEYPFDITAIVTVADDGGSSGRLRDEYDIPPPGDVRNVIAALSEVEPLVEQMFQYRFSQDKDLQGHSLGNLMLAALTDITGDFSHAIVEMSRVLQVHGQVLPVANKKITLHATLQDGTVIEGESKIPDATSPIESLAIVPSDVQPLTKTLRAIERADFILIGPGSLYTSIIPNLLVKDVGEAVARAKARKIYICNIMTQRGETINYTAEDHVHAIHKHVGQKIIDTILVNDFANSAPVNALCTIGKSEPVTYDVARLKAMGLEVIEGDIAIIRGDTLRHRAKRVGDWLYEYSKLQLAKQRYRSRIL